ncbi:MauE/DoxX family redox-associated membrane protein [Streptomyces inhibens]|uniref:MauE/DoxX family redox-associated membrane protein n=1 Tax=Streptomyces inhibens TaxID=2293571 RepID=UPI00379E064D
MDSKGKARHEKRSPAASSTAVDPRGADHHGSGRRRARACAGLSALSRTSWPAARTVRAGNCGCRRRCVSRAAACRGRRRPSRATTTRPNSAAVQYLVITVRTMIGVVFLTAFLSTSAGRGRFVAFVESVTARGVVPAPLVGLAAGSVVIAEGAVCALLIVPSADITVAGLQLAAVLLSVFTATTARTARQGTGATCRCFGALATPLGHRHLVRDVLLTAISAAAGLMAPANQGAATATGAGVAAPAHVRRSLCPRQGPAAFT